MGKKGSKRKTRWRTLSIGAPPGEEDEKEGLRSGYVKGQDKSHPCVHSFERNGQGGYTPRRSASSTSRGYSGGGGTKSHEDDSRGLQSQPKIIFNEDEYTRITTPRQDVLFKKGYLTRKKPWVGNASTSATPSTTESQSASHSTADGSETTEDQQLLDRDSGSGEYPPVMEPGAQLGYGTFYDHASGYYYEYPVMLVGPAPVPAQLGPNVLTAMPCGPVPLRPIEWINPAFVPKLGGQPYCTMDCQTGQNIENGARAEEEEENAQAPVENPNGTCNESGNGSASCTGSILGEVEEHADEEVTITKENEKEKEKEKEKKNTEGCVEETQQPAEEQPSEEQFVETPLLGNGMNDVSGPYLEPVLVQPPMHVSHVIPTVPQPYMYPGHYMFGPPLVNVNGVTLQSGPMIRTADVAAMTALASAKRRKKKKKRKQRRLALDNAEDEEEAEYSSEYDNGLTSSRVPWTGSPTSSTNTTTTSTTRPLNPECQEFQLRTVGEPHTSLVVVPTSNEITSAAEESNGANSSSSEALPSEPATAPAVGGAEVACNGSIAEDRTVRENGPVTDHAPISSLENRQFSTLANNGLNDAESERLMSCRVVKEVATSNAEITKTAKGAQTESDEAPLRTDIIRSANDLPSANEKCERSMDELDVTVTPPNTPSQFPKDNLTNGKADSDCYSDEMEAPNATQVPMMANPSSPQMDDSPLEKVQPRSFTPKTSSTEPLNGSRRSLANRDSSNHKVSNTSPKRKYSAKGSKFVREATPGPELDNMTDGDLDIKKETLCNKTQLPNNVAITNNTCSKSQFTPLDNTAKPEDQESDNYSSEMCHCSEDKVIQDEAIEASTEDSGFESQPRRMQYPITEAVKDWLRKANSPDLFITCRVTSDSETEDEVDVKEKPPKNLHGNPMPALSANGSTDNDVSLSDAADYGEFARTSNNEGDHTEAICATAASRKKRDLKGAKRKLGERANRRGAKGSVERMQDQVASSSDSCCHQENSLGSMRSKSLPKQNVGDVCEFSEKDSVADMRVAVNSRVDSKRVNERRVKRSGKSNREPVENVDLKMRRVDDRNDVKDKGIVDDTVSVRTFEKGEIIVSEHGKLLTPSSYQPFVSNGYKGSSVTNATLESEGNVQRQKVRADKIHNNNNNNSEEESVHAMIQSVGSIEEPDVLECWEAETIEPVITPRKMLQSRGIYCEGEAAEDDNFEIEHANIEHVQKYYRLARESATSLEEEASEINTCISSLTSRTVPNNTDEMVESFYSEEIPIALPTGQEQGNIGEDKKAPVDEAFEVYESCYTGKAQFQQIDSKLFKEKTLYGGTGEGPIPCRAACCNIQ